METEKLFKITDESMAMEKAKNFCAYQERSQQEVRDKLYEWGLWPEAVENTISKLITENFLNEERFASAYARGKFNQKGWGRNKIKQGLKIKRIPDILIKKALNQIEDEAYILSLKRLLNKKAGTISENNPSKLRYKLQQYALGRGYESELIADVLKNNGL